jgi:hypothetical protein
VEKLREPVFVCSAVSRLRDAEPILRQDNHWNRHLITPGKKRDDIGMVFRYGRQGVGIDNH